MSSSLLQKEKESDWIHLQEGKEFSRLLYPNPVCFLCTHDNEKANVMTITWLTATNDHGRFMMSVNRRRHTANFLSKPNQEFALCVPIAGMEDLVLAVGSTSGKFGSKFRDNHPEQQLLPSLDDLQPSLSSSQGMSKRQKKKQQQKQWAKGISGLVKVPIGENVADTASTDCQKRTSESPFSEEETIFCIQGTIAHLHCRTYSVMEEAIDEEHYLVLGEVVDAYCHADYWEASKKLFRPKPGVKPYLTFFGSQTFGHVEANQNANT